MHNFICDNCGKEVATTGNIGTHQRNHCPFCLYSKHVDRQKGDRNEKCQGLMQPIALTFKKEGEGRVGELMLVHQCQTCGSISINRLAGDDDAEKVMEIFEKSLEMHEQEKVVCIQQGIDVLGEGERHEVRTQLFGK